MTEIPKAYEPQQVEAKWYEFWIQEECFKADAASDKPPFSMVIPPPNVTEFFTWATCSTTPFKIFWLAGSDAR